MPEQPMDALAGRITDLEAALRDALRIAREYRRSHMQGIDPADPCPSCEVESEGETELDDDECDENIYTHATDCYIGKSDAALAAAEAVLEAHHA